MEYFQPTSSELRISRIGFGCAAVSGHDYGKVDKNQAVSAIRKAWDEGVNLFDTADVYGFGYTETILADALGIERHQAIIATKFGVNWDGSGRTYSDCSVRRMTEALEDSLRRLRLDCIPIYLVHRYDGITPLSDLMSALKECQKQGKIRYIGCSKFSVEMVLKASAIHKIDVIQLPYNLVRREYGPQLSKSIETQNMSTMTYDVLARGLLTGKYDKKARFGENDTRSKARYFTGSCLDSGLQIVKRLERIGLRHHKTPAQVAIKWALGKPFVNCVLIGNKHVSQVTENIDVFEWSLTQEDRNELEEGIRDTSE